MVPDAVLRYVGVLVRAVFPTLDDFYDLRKRAELIARQRTNFTGDVELAAIYAAWPSKSMWTDDAIRYAMKCELDLEVRIVQARPAAADALTYARAMGKRVIAISDTYMSQEQVAPLLAAAGITESFDAMYLSGECGARKDRGDLWTYVRARENVPVHSWLHIGDNEHSDVQRASDLGITVFHMMNPSTLARARGLQEALPYVHDSNWHNDLVLGPMVRHIGRSPFLPMSNFHPLALTTPFEVGFVVFGPIAFGFTSWLTRQLRERNIERVFFLAREGYALKAFYDSVLRHLPTT